VLCWRLSSSSRAILLFPRRNFNPGTDWTGFNLFLIYIFWLFRYTSSRSISHVVQQRVLHFIAFRLLYTSAAAALLCILSPDPPPSSCPFPYIKVLAASIIIVWHSAERRHHSRGIKSLHLSLDKHITASYIFQKSLLLYYILCALELSTRCAIKCSCMLLLSVHLLMLGEF
jgi:hypothetical protein